MQLGTALTALGGWYNLESEITLEGWSKNTWISAGNEDKFGLDSESGNST